jgi:hypothetical protein
MGRCREQSEYVFPAGHFASHALNGSPILFGADHPGRCNCGVAPE